MSVQAQTVSGPIATKVSSVGGFHVAFIVAWAICLLFYFLQYAVRSAPSVMLPELTSAFGLSTLGASSVIGLYYYTYSTFALVSGASLDRWGAKYTISIGVFFCGWPHHVWCRLGLNGLCRPLAAGSRCRLCFRRRGLSGHPRLSLALSGDRDRLHPVPRHARRIGRSIRRRAAGAWRDELAAILALRRIPHRARIQPLSPTTMRIKLSGNANTRSTSATSSRAWRLVAPSALGRR